MNHAPPTDSSPLRVLAVIPGKAEDVNSMPFLRRQIESLAAAGVDVQPFFLESRVSPPLLLKQWRALRKALRVIQPDLVHAHFGTVTALFSAIASDKPLMITYRGSDLNPTPAVHPLRNAMAKVFSQLASLRARKIICVSEQLRQRLWWRSKDAEVLSDGIDLELFRPVDRYEARRQLGWDREEEILLFTTRNDPVGKRLALAEAAAKHAAARRPNVRLVVLRGKTPSEEMPLLYSAADCTLMTSKFEGSPNIVKEAIACNCPVVSVDVGDVRERLEGVWPSFLAEPTGESLGEAVCRVLDLGLRSNGRDTIESVGQEAVAARIVELYRQAA